MATDFVDFIKDIQSINTENLSGFAFFCGSVAGAEAIQKILYKKFNMQSLVDADNDDYYYVIPSNGAENRNLLNFIRCGLDYDKNQKFVQHLITLRDAKVAAKMHNVFAENGYNVTIKSNNIQLVVKCLDNSKHNDEICELKRKLSEMEKTTPQSVDDYLSKVLFNNKIRNFEYRAPRKWGFDIEKVERNKDAIIREILYRYFDKRIRAHLLGMFFPKKFDANKLDDETKQDINLIYEYLYSVTEKYIDKQIQNATRINQKVSVRFDYLKGLSVCRDFYTLSRRAKQWHEDFVKLSKKRQKLRKESDKGIYKIMEFEDGYYVVQLFTPQSLDFEGASLEHCVGKGYYDGKIYGDFLQMYSLRDKWGTPRLTIEVKNGKITQCAGHKSQIPTDSVLRDKIRKFMYEQCLDIDKWNKLIAYIKQDGVLYDVFNLPKNFTINGSIDLCAMKLYVLPDMQSITIKNNFICATNALTDLVGAPHTVDGDVEFGNNPLTSLRGMPRNIGSKIYLSHTCLHGKSFVPIYMENKLDDVVGISDKVRNAWKKQVKDRKNTIANIIASLSNSRKK